MTASAPLPDASAANWVDRWAPERLKPWLKLGRFDRPVGIWLLMLPGWQGVALACAERERWPDVRLLLLFGLGAAAMRAAGCAYNDIVDRDLDRQVVRTAGRPVASGAISVKAAWAYLVALSLAGLLILLTLNRFTVVLGVVSLGLVAAYPFMKRITWWPQAWLGLTFNWGALMGYAAVAGELSWTAGLLYAAGVFWTLGYDTIYALQDIEDDALAGVKSSARRLGANARRGVIGFYAASAGLLAFLPARIGPLYFAGLLVYALHLAWQTSRLSGAPPERALRLFKSNVWAGLTLLAAITAGALQL